MKTQNYKLTSLIIEKPNGYYLIENKGKKSSSSFKTKNEALLFLYRCGYTHYQDQGNDKEISIKSQININEKDEEIHNCAVIYRKWVDEVKNEEFYTFDEREEKLIGMWKGNPKYSFLVGNIEKCGEDYVVRYNGQEENYNGKVIARNEQNKGWLFTS